MGVGFSGGGRMQQSAIGIVKGRRVNEVQALAEAVLEAATVAGIGVMVSFDDGICPRIIYINPTAAATLGAEVDELLGEVAFSTFEPDGSRRINDFVHRWRREVVAPVAFETAVIWHNGRQVPVEISVSGVDLEGTPAIVAFIRDIQERKELQAQLAFSDRMATLGMLAAGVAHEINNPLGYASLNIEAIARRLTREPAPIASEFQPDLDAVREGLARVATIVRDLQSLSTPKSVERWPVNVNDVVQSTLNVAMHEIRGRARVAIRCTEVSLLKTDPTRLGQVLLNLVINAAQSFQVADESKNLICIDVDQIDCERVTICVTDNGPGIAKEHLGRIFEPFFTTKSSGMGLGLAICQSLAGAIGAQLDVSSELGQGTKFTLSLWSAGLGQGSSGETARVGV